MILQIDKIELICKTLSEINVEPKTELNYLSHYTFLIAVVLSAQSTDVQVNKITGKLFDKYKTIDDFLTLGVAGLQNEIKSIGLYKNKAKHIIQLSKILEEQFDGRVPDNRKDLESLPGVGRKTANVVLNTLFNMPTIAVDTHVIRCSNRIGFSNSLNPLEIEKDLEKIIPTQYKSNISNLIVLHGRYVCKAKKPSCNNCCINNICMRNYIEKQIHT